MEVVFGEVDARLVVADRVVDRSADEDRVADGERLLIDDVLERVMDVVTYVRYQDTVMQEWGFGKKYQKGRGTMVLFSGPSGTGKTLAAEIIAGQLGLDVYKLDLSSVEVGDWEEVAAGRTLGPWLRAGGDSARRGVDARGVGGPR